MQLLGIAGNQRRRLFRDGAEPDHARPLFLRRRTRPRLQGRTWTSGASTSDTPANKPLSNGDYSIVELNGTTGESTNPYDPKKSIFWAYRVLMGQWKLLFELGSARMRRALAQ